MTITSKQRSYLKGLAMNISPIIQIGKGGVTPEVTQAAAEALEARELIKLHVLKNNDEDIKEQAAVLSERTRSVLVQVIGRMIVLYKQASDEKKREITLPKG